jgi:hypothetical protein
MNSYIFLTDEGYTFQPETEDEPVVIDSLQTIGTARGTDAMDAYRNLLAETPQLAERKYEKVFCYQVDEPLKEKGKTLN